MTFNLMTKFRGQIDGQVHQTFRLRGQGGRQGISRDSFDMDVKREIETGWLLEHDPWRQLSATSYLSRTTCDERQHTPPSTRTSEGSR